MKFFRPRQAPTLPPAQSPVTPSDDPVAPTGDMVSANGMASYSHGLLPKLRRFEDIPVVPVASEERMIFNGGPVWPDWDGAGDLRHQRSGLPVDQAPTYNPDALNSLETPAIWGGHISPHFGHFLAEHSTRLLTAARMRPDLTVLLTLPPRMSARKLPKFVWQVLNWYQIDPERIHFVTKPLKVREFWALPMAEQWAHIPPSEAYLDMLDANAVRQGFTGAPTEVVYVARDGFERTAEGHNAGESYLTSVLPQVGVTVIRPETMGLREQLETYHSARTLIFAEGSAMHGRQLLGRVDQHIAVLNRRPKMRIALSALHPRCRQLSYAEVTRGLASVVWPNGNPWLVRAISAYDPKRLLDTFTALGIPLEDVWEAPAFEDAQEQAIRTWIKIRFAFHQPIDHQASRKRVKRELSTLGFEQLANEVPDKSN